MCCPEPVLANHHGFSYANISTEEQHRPCLPAGHICDTGLPHAARIHAEDAHYNRMGDLNTWEEELTRTKEHKPTSAAGVKREGYVRVEMETFRRLPRSGFILFTVRTYQDAIRDVERAPVAAQAMAAAVRRAHKGILHYHQMATGFEKGVLEYLDGVTESAGLVPFRCEKAALLPFLCRCILGKQLLTKTGSRQTYRETWPLTKPGAVFAKGRGA
jgi:hypothetical protein